MPPPDRSRRDMSPHRNPALELVRVTEAAALGAARIVGLGDKEAADQAAVDGMHAVLETIHMDGVVIIGEGEKDEGPMPANRERGGARGRRCPCRPAGGGWGAGARGASTSPSTRWRARASPRPGGRTRSP